MAYDSRRDTIDHILNVQGKTDKLINELKEQVSRHDLSKLGEQEKKYFDIYTDKLKETTYGSDEYKERLCKMKKALNHHYKFNRHHPEHFDDGIHGMNLIDIIEMFCDWMSSVERHDDGDIYNSIEINQKRFGYSDDLKNILKNTAKLYTEE